MLGVYKPDKWDFIEGVSGDMSQQIFGPGHIYYGQKNSTMGGKPHGLGIWIPSDGTWLYEGQFDQLQFNGKGRLIYSSGTYFEGQFSKGQMNGLGKLYQ